jgi:hypothetical protein
MKKFTKKFNKKQAVALLSPTFRFLNAVVSNLTPEYAAEIPHTRYARAIITHFNQDHIDRLTKVFEEIGVALWLEQNPLTRLELTRKVVDEDEIEVNGLYSFKNKTIQVATERSTDEYHKVFEWQRVHLVSSTGQTPLEVLQKTLIHELGHHIHNILSLTDSEAFGKTLRTHFLAGGTSYAQSSKYEYFAETFALYVFFRDELLKHDSGGHAMIEQALACVGLEVNRL